MTERRLDKCCVILLGMGGPDSPEGVRRYLVNIFSDRSIIRLPGGPWLQKPFAHLIALLRRKKVASHYRLIGGRSPLLDWTIAQKEHLENFLRPTNPNFLSVIGMRYYDPFTVDAIKDAYNRGYRHFCFFPMYPQYCRATTGSSFEEAARGLDGLPGVTTNFIKDFHDHPGYIALLRDYIESNIKPNDTLLFSAHSIPIAFVKEGDPYVEQVKRTAKLASGTREYFISFQSRTGPVEWVGPDTIEEAGRLLRERPGNLFVVPISFVCDHIETMYEIDIELKALLGDGLGDRIRRMPMFNADPRFGRVIADIVQERAGLNGGL
ncbi:ferrochelatase [candidate division GN15 bacterium]|uniref:Ferrochelatase n=1 Tax=candidate division GN15 bacterium TaxID=2072418 RepID=A0A855XDJ1_9BACT|nr:MAG: ferrochelatase [candidate division GN15 bacterium]